MGRNLGTRLHVFLIKVANSLIQSHPAPPPPSQWQMSGGLIQIP